MRTMWIVIGAVLLLGLVSIWYVTRRDRARTTSGEDAAAARIATAEQERHAAERHGAQGGAWQRGQQGPG
ncbi:hypothetical protein [Micromonospora siamensis]|uniref:Uncharacterized protein n=1 Tax=Micromonospora siamensis TaxID=299152 RepID=A0A1C5IE96_9ACTN|nr:hypothetical protein [Micromonospora siamensis]SCG56722.1 hypothetical protein GA0074704_3300 [Micromonospora siamensis]